MGTTVERQHETHEEAIRRLARRAHERGLQVLVYPRTNEHYVASVSHPGTLHRVTMATCDCSGFLRHRRCVHHAAVLAMYGALPVVPAPSSPLAA